MTAPLKLHKQTPVRGNRRLIPAQGVLAGSGGRVCVCVCGGEPRRDEKFRETVCLFSPVGQYWEPEADVGITREKRIEEDERG